jgi:hypothetical protein
MPPSPSIRNKRMDTICTDVRSLRSVLRHQMRLRPKMFGRLLVVSGGRVYSRIACDSCGQDYVVNRCGKTRFCSECLGNPTSESERGPRLHRLMRYGMTHREYLRMLESQEGRCRLCPEKAVFVDHCHERNVVRGLLCPACNTALGRIDKVPGWTDRALEYVESFR